MSDFIWSPTAEDVESANVTRLARSLGVERYADLHRISVEEPERFWPAVIEDLGLEFSEPWEQVVDTSRGSEWATWFTGGKLNLAWNCVHRWAAGELAEQEAAVWQGEDGERSRSTWRELSDEVFRLAEGLASIGIGEGDAVGIFLPMSPQVAIASHACAHLGAVQVPIFSGFAAPAIAARLADAKAKALITADGSLRRGQLVPMKQIADEALESAATVTHTVVWRRLGLEDVPMTLGRDRFWDELVDGTSGDLAPRQVDSEHPYLLAYTSGTTGKPKGALHVQAGFLVSIAREVAYQTNVKPGRPHPLRHGHGLDHGPVDGGRRRRVRRDRCLRGRRARLSGGPHLEADRVRARDDARRFPDTRTRAHPERRPAGRHVHVEGDLHDRRAVESRSVPLVVREGRRRQCDADRQLLRRHRGRGVLPHDLLDGADQAGRARVPGAWPGHGRVRAGRHARCAAKSASSCANGPGPE